MLIPTKDPTPNPYEPFTYAAGEIRHVDDAGHTYDADVWETRAGWRWSARWNRGEDPNDAFALSTDGPAAEPLPTETEAASAAATWLRRFLPSSVGA